MGGVIKWICDRVVANNADVSSFEEFFDCIENNIAKVRLVPAAHRDK